MNGGGIWLDIDYSTNPTIPIPIAHNIGNPTTIQIIFQTEVNKWFYKKVTTNTSVEIFHPIYSQFTEYLNAKLESLDGWKSIKDELKMLELLCKINKLVNKNKNTQYPDRVVRDSLEGIYTLKQGP